LRHGGGVPDRLARRDRARDLRREGGSGKAASRAVDRAVSAASVPFRALLTRRA
jgi:hypothetical protein